MKWEGAEWIDRSVHQLRSVPGRPLCCADSVSGKGSLHWGLIKRQRGRRSASWKKPFWGASWRKTTAQEAIPSAQKLPLNLSAIGCRWPRPSVFYKHKRKDWFSIWGLRMNGRRIETLIGGEPTRKNRLKAKFIASRIRTVQVWVQSSWRNQPSLFSQTSGFQAWLTQLCDIRQFTDCISPSHCLWKVVIIVRPTSEDSCGEKMHVITVPGPSHTLYQR